MKRSVVMLAVFLSLAVSALAQVQGGTIGGTVQDEQGGVLPGVTVTLQGVDATRETVTGTDGSFRFIDLAPGPYALTAALAGFSTIVQDRIVVAVGKTVDIRLTTKIAGLAETITVSGGAPLIDTKATGTAVNFTSDELAKIPTSRDPFAR
jgi:carboxypeptidase family protein